MVFCCCEPFTCARILTGIELGLTILSVYGSFTRVGIIGGKSGTNKSMKFLPFTLTLTVSFTFTSSFTFSNFNFYFLMAFWD